MTVVVVAESDGDLRLLLTDGVRHAGFDAVGVVDGVEALGAAREPHVRAVVIDAALPALSGLQVCQRLRLEFPNRHLPILVFACADGDDHRLAALAAGADDYLVRPLHLGVLTSRLARLIEREASLRMSPGFSADLAGFVALNQARTGIDAAHDERRRASA
jgi:putative two-component system response regulator